MKPKPTEPTPPPLTYIDTLPPEEQASLRAFREEIFREARARHGGRPFYERLPEIRRMIAAMELTDEECDRFQQAILEIDKLP